VKGVDTFVGGIGSLLHSSETEATAFVTFYTMTDAASFSQLKLSENTSKFRLRISPSPADIVWSNITFPHHKTKRR
jgi:hypothetical protein